jgi:hypothetical protein
LISLVGLGGEGIHAHDGWGQVSPHSIAVEGGLRQRSQGP